MHLVWERSEGKEGGKADPQGSDLASRVGGDAIYREDGSVGAGRTGKLKF